MVDQVYDAFLEEKARQESLGISCESEVEGVSGFVFCNRFNLLLHEHAINRLLDRIIDKYNPKEELRAKREKRNPILVPRFTCHYTRHTFCTRLCEADVPIKVIQQVMGHKDIQTTMDIYAEVTRDKKKTSLDEIVLKEKLF